MVDLLCVGSAVCGCGYQDDTSCPPWVHCAHFSHFLRDNQVSSVPNRGTARRSRAARKSFRLVCLGGFMATATASAPCPVCGQPLAGQQACPECHASADTLDL